LGRLSSLAVEELNRPSIKHEKTIATLAKKLERYKGRQSLEIRGFPTSSLSIEGLEVFLDTLDRLYNYTPDVLLLDYADLMKLDYKNLRTSTGEIYKELRRIAVERNLAMVTASQANRMAEDARVITLKHLAEDYSKAATADTVIAYCQTPQEKNLGLARLFVAKARGQESGQMVLISQAYGLGQFCMDSTSINDRYWTMLEEPSEETSTPTPTQRPRFRPRNSS
jgi:replicative DNA helicase